MDLINSLEKKYIKYIYNIKAICIPPCGNIIGIIY